MVETKTLSKEEIKQLSFEYETKGFSRALLVSTKAKVSERMQQVVGAFAEVLILDGVLELEEWEQIQKGTVSIETYDKLALLFDGLCDNTRQEIERIATLEKSLNT